MSTMKIGLGLVAAMLIMLPAFGLADQHLEAIDGKIEACQRYAAAKVGVDKPGVILDGVIYTTTELFEYITKCVNSSLKYNETYIWNYPIKFVSDEEFRQLLELKKRGNNE